MHKFNRTLAIAIAIHIAAIALLPLVPRRGSGAESSAPSVPPEDWELALDGPAAAETAGSKAVASLDRVEENRPANLVTTERGAASKKLDTSDERPPPAEVPPTPSPTWSFSPTVAPPVDLAIGNRFGQSPVTASLAGVGADDRAGASGGEAGLGDGAATAARRNGSTVLRDSLHAADVAKGRAIGNPILKIARDVTLAVPSPTVGDVVFEARFDGGGRIVDVRLVSCDGDAHAWDNVKRGLVDALAARSLPVTAAASHGVLVSFAIKSRWALPSSHGPGVELGLPLVPGLKTSKGAKDPTRVVLTVLPRDTSTGATPGIDVNVGTDLDPTDPVAKPQRTVATRIVEEKLL